MRAYGQAKRTLTLRQAQGEELVQQRREGINLADYQARWGQRPSPEKIGPLIEQGMLRQDGDILSATPQGRLILNAVIAALLN